MMKAGLTYRLGAFWLGREGLGASFESRRRSISHGGTAPHPQSPPRKRGSISCPSRSRCGLEGFAIQRLRYRRVMDARLRGHDSVGEGSHKKSGVSYRVALSSFLAVSVALVGLAYAAPAPSPIPAGSPPSAAASSAYLVVDVQKIMAESKAAQSAQARINAQRSRHQKEVAEEEKRLREDEQALKAQRATLSPEEFDRQAQALRDRFRVVERDVQGRRRSLNQAFTAAMSQVRTALHEVMSDVARQRQAVLVLPRQSTLWADPSIDVTDQVLEGLNRKLPEVTVSLDSSEANTQNDRDESNPHDEIGRNVPSSRP